MKKDKEAGAVHVSRGRHFDALTIREKDTSQLTVWVSQSCYVKYLQL